MSEEPEYPVAVIGDGFVEVHESSIAVQIAVEEPELPGVMVIYSRGKPFRLVADETQSWLGNLLGSQPLYRMVAFSGVVPEDVVSAAEAVLSARPKGKP